MTSQFDPPLNANPSDIESLSAALKFALRNFSMDMDGMIPAIVQAYDPVKNIATVRPQIMITLRSGDKVSRMPLVGVPVLSIGAGGFHMYAPLREGDLGWIFAADRDTSLFMQDLTEQGANTIRTKNFIDGLFIPDVFRKYTILDEDKSALVLQSTDAATRISIREDNIKITATSNVTVDSPQTTVLHDATVQGNAVVQGNGTIQGTTDLQNVNVHGTLMVGSINMNTHHHTAQGAFAPTTGPQ